jgi:hypothetical protein
MGIPVCSAVHNWRCRRIENVFRVLLTDEGLANAHVLAFNPTSLISA